MNTANTPTPRTAVIGLLTALLWVVQVAGSWETPPRFDPFAQSGDSGLTAAIQRDWGSFSRVWISESPSDPVAMPGAGAPGSGDHFGRDTGTPANTPILHERAHALPGIRAPPIFFRSV